MTAALHRISIPNPFFEGRNSVYVIKEDPITLIDTGIATDKAFDVLVDGLRELALSVADIRRVILTHKHIDHIGNAWRIQQEGGAEVMIHESELKSLANVDPSGKRFTALARDRMQAWGVPEQEIAQLSSPSMPLWQLESCDVLGLCDQQQLPMDAAVIEVIHTPGHTRGSICLKWGEHLFSGDHVLETLSPNVGAGDLRSRGLLRDYMNSLEKIRDLEVRQLHPGHGAMFSNHAARCNELLSHHEARLDAVHSILRDGEATVYDVARALFGVLNDFHLLLGCAEANAHLELLAERGTISSTDGRYLPRQEFPPNPPS